MNTDADINKLLLDTQQLVGHPEDADNFLVVSRLSEFHFSTPGIIQSFDKDTQTASIQPAIRRFILPDAKMIQLPICVDVPVCFYGGVLTFEVKRSDEALLVFGERSIDFWHARGGIQDPSEMRMCDLSDAFAFVGFNSLPKVLQDIHATAAELRLRNGSNRISVRDDGTTHIGTSASASIFAPLVNGAVVASGIDPFTKMTYGALGNASINVMVKK